MNWDNLKEAQCPACDSKLRDFDPVGDYIDCSAPHCRFRIGKDKFFRRFKRGTMAYWKLKHNSRSEEENMRDIASLI